MPISECRSKKYPKVSSFVYYKVLFKAFVKKWSVPTRSLSFAILMGEPAFYRPQTKLGWSFWPQEGMVYQGSDVQGCPGERCRECHVYSCGRTTPSWKSAFSWKDYQPNNYPSSRRTATSAVGEAINQFYFPILVPVGVVGNILSFLVMIQPHNRHMSFSIYIAALAVSDTYGVLIAIPIYLDQVHEVDMPPSRLGYCTSIVFGAFSSFLCSAYILIAITFERFYSIIRPHKAASFNTVKRAKIIILSVFLSCFIYSIPNLFIVGNDGRLCIPNRFASDYVLAQIYSWFTEVLLLVFPFISLLIMNSVLIHTLRKRSKLHFTGLSSQSETEHENMKTKNSEKQVFTMVLLITFAFLILNIPTRALIYYLNFYSGNTPHYYAGLYLFYQVGEKCHYTNHGINFFLYVISGKKFRSDLFNLFKTKEAKSSSVASNVRNVSFSVSTVDANVE